MWRGRRYGNRRDNWRRRGTDEGDLCARQSLGTVCGLIFLAPLPGSWARARREARGERWTERGPAVAGGGPFFLRKACRAAGGAKSETSKFFVFSLVYLSSYLHIVLICSSSLVLRTFNLFCILHWIGVNLWVVRFDVTLFYLNNPVSFVNLFSYLCSCIYCIDLFFFFFLCI